MYAQLSQLWITFDKRFDFKKLRFHLSNLRHTFTIPIKHLPVVTFYRPNIPDVAAFTFENPDAVATVNHQKIRLASASLGRCKYGISIVSHALIAFKSVL